MKRRIRERGVGAFNCKNCEIFTSREPARSPAAKRLKKCRATEMKGCDRQRVRVVHGYFLSPNMNPPVSTLLTDKGTVIHSAPVSAMVEDAVQVMNRHKVGSVVIMDGDRLVGIFTERDVLYRVVAAGLPPASTPVSRVMTANPKVISPDTTVEEALAMISEKRCRHLPVIENGRMLGLISQGDITRWLVQAHRAQAQQLLDYITGGPGQ
jgi:CBS domain-containing protein